MRARDWRARAGPNAKIWRAILPAVLVVGVMFWVAHHDHGITITHLPFQMTASIVAGFGRLPHAVAHPAMIAHAAADLIIQPVYFYQRPVALWKALTAQPIWETPEPDQIFAMLAVGFMASALLTISTLVRCAFDGERLNL